MSATLRVHAEKGAKVRVLVVDDQPVFRYGLRTLLEAEGSAEVVGETPETTDVVELVVSTETDVVVMDSRPSGELGADTVAALRAECPDVRVLIFSANDNEDDLLAAVRAGAAGYLRKSLPAAEVLPAVLAVAAGQSLISPDLAARLLDEFAVMSIRDEKDQQPRLTERELEVLGLVARGLSNRLVAEKLFISENTVKNHIRNILEKLQLHSRTEAAVYAIQRNLIG
jgi:DNA-binding NarL/FixJ family response regulator